LKFGTIQIDVGVSLPGIVYPGFDLGSQYSIAEHSLAGTFQQVLGSLTMFPLHFQTIIQQRTNNATYNG
jgi:hypothetical protein